MDNIKKMLVVGAVLSGAFVLSACNLYKQSFSANKTPSGQTGEQQQTTTTESPVAGNVITYSDSGFSPAEIRVKTGEAVEFKNTSSSTLVQVNSAVHPTHTLYLELNIGLIAKGESKSVTFTTAGTRKYHNHFNPSQFGQIDVE